MKTNNKLYFLVALGITLVVQNKYTQAADVNFELINKTNKTAFIALGDQQYPALQNNKAEIIHIEPNQFLPGTVDTKQGVQILILDDKAFTDPKIPNTPAILYRFAPDSTGSKTFYIQLTEKGLEPQTGSILKFGNTQRGYSLKNNVTANEINKGIPVQFVTYTKK